MSKRTNSWYTKLPVVVKENEILAKYSQYGIGGPADAFCVVHEVEQLPLIVLECLKEGVPMTLLGAGSNTLILDSGLEGLVIKIADKRSVIDITNGKVVACAGVMMPRLALDCAKSGAAGVEFGIGIPGTAGASVIGNAGAFGHEIKDVLLSCEVLQRNGEIVEQNCSELDMSYRWSVFKQEQSDDIVCRATFRVAAGDPQVIRTTVDGMSTIRKTNQPYGNRSLGSTFKNPENDYAGRLIDSVGLKGFRVGGAQISDKHANFIINIDHASAADVFKLVTIMHDRVFNERGVDLQKEIVVLGRTPGRNSRWSA